MASRSSALGNLAYESESAFGENVGVSSMTRLRPIGAITYDLHQDGLKVDILKQRPNEGVEYVRAPHAGTLAFDLNLTGLGATCAGAVPSSDLVTLLGLVLGTAASGLATGTTATGGTASAPTTTAASGISAGALVRFGAIGDARGGGQFAAVSSHASNTANLLTAIGAAPNNGDVIYSSKMVYPSQAPGTHDAITGLRFLVQTTMQQYLLHGCYLTGIELVVNLGEVPRVRLTFAVSWYESANQTFPSASSVQDYTATPVAGGSMFLQAMGTATRNALAARSVSMSIGLDNRGVNGINGNNAYQLNVDAYRAPAPVMVEMVLDAEAAGTDTYGTLWEASPRVQRHGLYTMSAIDGRALGIYWPKLTMTRRPVQFDDGGTLRQRLSFEALTSDVTTSDLTLSPYRIAFA